MPVMDGWEMRSRVKSNPKTKHIPVIALSAHAMAGDKERAINAGFDGYMTKPINIPSLLTDLREVIKNVKPSAEVVSIPSDAAATSREVASAASSEAVNTAASVSTTPAATTANDAASVSSTPTSDAATTNGDASVSATPDSDAATTNGDARVSATPASGAATTNGDASSDNNSNENISAEVGGVSS
jgi:DNA-binding response OmpR family regulator